MKNYISIFSRNRHRVVNGWRAPIVIIVGFATALAATAPAATTDAVSDLSGVWIITAYSPVIRTDDGKEPPLLPAAAEIYGKRKALFAKGDVNFETVASRCNAPGMPRVMMIPYPFEIVQNSNRLAFLFQWNRLFRRVDIDGPSHDADDLQWSGRSVGHWENNTLVIETRQIDDTFLDAAGMPHSEALEITERLHLLSKSTLENRMRFEDPKTFSEPWGAVVTYRKLPKGTEVGEDICLDRILTTPAIETRNYLKYLK